MTFIKKLKKLILCLFPDIVVFYSIGRFNTMIMDKFNCYLKRKNYDTVVEGPQVWYFPLSSIRQT